MQLLALTIYGFGKHQDKQITLTDGLNVFYGENEAGKTTLQQFILHIFYGFPTKNQKQQNYEPKNGHKYGGTITIKHPDYGVCTIARVRGTKVTGDVTITLQDGTICDEDFLAQLLYGYNKASLLAIFAFSSQELQGIEALSEEALTQVLLASGTTGVSQLTRATSILEKQAQERYKKSGKTPIMNRQLDQLKELEQNIKQYKRKIEQYATEEAQLQVISEEIATQQVTKQTLQRQWQDYTLLQQQLPLLIEQQKLQQNLEKLPQYDFTLEDEKRYTHIRDDVFTMQLRIKQLQEERAIKSTDLQFDEDLYERAKELLAKESTWHQNTSAITRLEEEIYTLERENAKQFRLLGIQDFDTQQQLLSQNVSLQQEEQFSQMLQDVRKVDDQVSLKLHSLNDLHKELEKLEATTDTEGIRKRRNQEREQRTRQIQFVKFVAAFGAILFFIMSALWQNIFTFIAGVACVLVFIYLFLQRLKATPEQFVEQQIEMTKQRYVNMQEEVKQLEQQQLTYENALQEVLQRFFITPITDRGLMSDLFKRVRALQEAAETLHTKDIWLAQKRQEQAQLIVEIEEVIDQALIKEYSYAQLRTQVEEWQRKYVLFTEAKARIKAIDQELEQLSQTITDHEAWQREWLRMKQLNADEVFQAFEIWHKTEQINTRLFEIDQQITITEPPTLDYVTIQAKLEQLAEEQAQLDDAMQVALEEQAQLKIWLEHTINDETYGELLQQYEDKLAAFTEQAKAYMAERAVQIAIEETFTKLREEKLPQVLRDATKYFTYLTNTQYTKLFVNNSGYFEVEGAHGRFHMSELSQATKQQAYVALRFALANTLTNAPLPFIMDDPFVHFDRNRYEHMLQLIRELSQKRQVIYFTCQSTSWQDTEMIKLGEE